MTPDRVEAPPPIATPRWRDPSFLQRHAGKLVLLLGAALLWFGLRDVHFARIAAEDDSTPGIAPGSRVFVRTLEEDDFELQRGALYLIDLAGDAQTFAMLRMARLVGLPGDRVERRPPPIGRAGDLEAWIEGARLPLAPELAALLPAQVPDGHVLVLTDNPDCRHLDSRALGPIPVERLKLRVLASTDSFLR